MLGPEGVNDLGPFVAVVPPLFRLQGQRVEIGAHYLARRLVRPGSFFAVRAVAIVERHDLRLHLGLDVGQQALHLVEIDVGEFLLDDEPSDGVQVVPEHLHPKARALHKGRAAAHEDIGDFQMLERALLLVVGVVVVPDSLAACEGSSGALVAAAMSMDRKTLDRRRAHHFDIW